MNVSRFSARTARDALALVRESLGDDAVVLSTKPCAEGIEILAIAPDGLQQIEHMAATGLPAASSRAAATGQPRRSVSKVQARSDHTAELGSKYFGRESAGKAGAADVQSSANTGADVTEDVQKLSMSTLSFQDYVRERMLKRRQAALNASVAASRAQEESAADARALEDRGSPPPATNTPNLTLLRQTPRSRKEVATPTDARSFTPRIDEAPPLADAGQARARRDQQEMLDELRSVKGLIEERFGALAFIEMLQRRPVQARTAHRLLDCGFSPALTRKLTQGLPADATDDSSWASEVLERNLITDEGERALEDQGGVLALIGPTGVGKTTGAAKIAAAFTAKHGAANLGLITLDAYRLAAHEQLRAFGRILGVPVHIAHDRTSLEDLLDLLSAKKMVLIDTAGMAQRDTRTREVLDMLTHPNIKRLLVVNAAAQGETTEDVVLSYRGGSCAGVVLSKIDEAVKLAPVLDVLIRHKLKVVGVANGQRVPEDWHRLSSHALVQRALRASASTAYRMDPDEVSLVFTSANTVNAAAVSS